MTSEVYKTTINEGLNQSQIDHNMRLDYEIEKAERGFQHLEKLAKLKNEWFRKNYPDASEVDKKLFGMNMQMRRTVIGLYYVA